MGEQGGREYKVGITIGIICMKELPSLWVKHMDKWRSSIPGGMFWSFEYVIGKYYDEARNQVIRKAKTNGSKWVFFIDSDVFLPSDCLPKLLSHNKKIVSGVYWMKTHPPQPVVFEQLGNGPMWDIGEKDGLVPIGGAGAGCLLVHMDVFDAFDKVGIPYFKCDWDYINPADGKRIKVAVGEDHYFFIKAKELGFQPYADADILCDHYDVKNDRMYPYKEVVKKICERKAIKCGSGIDLKMQKYMANEEDNKPTIIFFNALSVPYNGDTYKTEGMGGTETSTVFMAREFKKYGCNVKVYCNCNKEGIYDGVLYQHFNNFNFEDKCDVFIGNRDVDIFKGPVNANIKIIWGHDVGDSSAWNNIMEVIHKVDYIFFQSNFHASTILDKYPNIPVDKILVTRSGVDTNLYKGNETRDRYKLIYTSTPYRGLDILLECFPKIKKQVPEVTLDIYSSMKLYGGAKDDDKIQELFKKADKIKGVRRFDPIPKEQLAKVQKSAWLLAYPNTFAETFCVSVAESLVAGTPVVTSHYGSLPEVVGKCGILIKEDFINNREEYKKKFIDGIVKLLKDEELWINYHKNCKNVQYSWTDLAEQLLKCFFGYKYNNSAKHWDNVYSHELPKGETREDDGRWDIIKKFIKKDSKVLDYGCGTGSFVNYILKYTNKIYGYDISNVAINYCKGKFKNAVFFTKEEDIIETFDFINLSHVLEHFEDPYKQLLKIKKLLKPNGRMAITVPIDDVEWYEHMTRFSRKSFKEFLDKLCCEYKLHHLTSNKKKHQNNEPFKQTIALVEFIEDPDWNEFICNIADKSSVLYLGKEKDLFKRYLLAYKPDCNLSISLDVTENSYDYVILDKQLENQKHKEALIEGIKKSLKKDGSLILSTLMDENNLSDLLNKTKCISTIEIYKDKIYAIIKFRR